ncbi:MAG: T9SS type A sorting domain-containing protein [Bacteroidia bacterium]
MRSSSVLCVLLLAFTHPVSAQWQATADVAANSQNVYALTAKGSYLYAGTGSAGVSRSDNSGSSWSTFSNGITCTGINAMTILGTSVFAGGDSGVFKVPTYENLWTQINKGLPVTTINTFLALHDTMIYAGTQNNGVYCSWDYGKNWFAANTGFTGQIVALASSGSALFAAAPNYGVYLSLNSGGLWTAVNTGLTNKDVSSLATIGSNVFVGTADGVFSTSNNGSNWASVNNGLSNKKVHALFALNSHLFAGTDSGVFYTGNLGINWNYVGDGMPAGTEVWALAQYGTDLFAGIHYEPYGVWKRPISQLTGLSEIDYAMDFTVYPNPGKNQVHVQLRNNPDTASEIKLFNLLGQEIISFPVPENSTSLSLDLAALSPGTYLLGIHGKEGVRLYKKLILSN